MCGLNSYRLLYVLPLTQYTVTLSRITTLSLLVTITTSTILRRNMRPVRVTAAAATDLSTTVSAAPIQSVNQLVSDPGHGSLGPGKEAKC